MFIDISSTPVRRSFDASDPLRPIAPIATNIRLLDVDLFAVFMKADPLTAAERAFLDAMEGADA